MLDAAGAVAAATGLLPRIGVTPVSPQAGVSVDLDASASSVGAGRSIAAYEWTLLDGGGIVSGFSSATNAATAALLPVAGGAFTVRLTITDDLGARGSVDRQVSVASAPAPTPTPTPTGSGGGTMGWPWLAALAAAVFALRRPR